MAGDGVRLLVLSDTHGELPEKVLQACMGANHIIHAGDVGSRNFLHELEAIAPLTSVLGNVDPPDLSPLRARLKVGGWRILVQHIVWERGGPSSEVRNVLGAEPADLVIFGHSHEPLCDQIGDVVFLNPGSCGPRRFSLPKSYGEAMLAPDGGCFRIFDLEGRQGDDPIVDCTFALGR